MDAEWFVWASAEAKGVLHRLQYALGARPRGGHITQIFAIIRVWLAPEQ